MNYERRSIADTVEIRDDSGGHGPQIVGYASMFNSESRNLGGFVETIGEAAFNKTIQEQDIRSLFNHDPSNVLGRMGAGTLKLQVVEGRGLQYVNDLPDTTLGHDVRTLIERGDIVGSSFGFKAMHDSWSLNADNVPVRHVTELSCRDVGPCTFPAYEGTEGALSSLAGRSMLPIEELRSLADTGHLYEVVNHLMTMGDDEGRATTPVAHKRRRVF